MVLRHTLLLTVVGPLLAAATDKGLLRLSFLGEAYEYRPRAMALARSLARVRGAAADDPDDVLPVEDPAAFDGLATQLGEYFSGRRRSFDLEMDLRGSEFQRRVWRSLLRIPYGRLRSYKQVAREIGRPAATRAVGQAVGDNPIAIVVPCHRVVGTNGGLVGFGGGMTLKAQLLRLEGHTLGDRPRVVAPRLF
jgi:methylated-DNA-[protein]-cysteine S-methyltransferase